MNHAAPSSRKVSIFRRVIFPFAIVAVLDCIILLALLMVSGTFADMRTSTLNNLGETALNKYQILENNMLDWMDLDEVCREMSSAISDTLKQQGKTTADMEKDPALNNSLADACKDNLVDALRVNNQSGAFLILNGIGIPGQPDSRAGIFLYDTETGAYYSNNSDISLLRGLPPLSRSLGIALHSFWKAGFTFEGGETNADNSYYYNPMNAYLNRKSTKSPPKYYGYWSPAFRVDAEDVDSVITYSRPVTDDNGTFYGIAGISVTMAALEKALDLNSLISINSDYSYYLGITKDNGSSYQCVMAGGAEFLANFSEHQELYPTETFQEANYNFLVVDSERTGKSFYGAVYPLHLYSRNTPFQEEQWVLIGLKSADKVFAMEQQLRLNVFMAIVLGLVVGLLIAFWSAARISKPITHLMKELNTSGMDENASVLGTGIIEVDALAQTIIQQKHDAVEEASRIAKIISLSGLPIGTFEVRQDTGDVFCSDDFFKLLNRKASENARHRLTQPQFEALMHESLGDKPELDDDIFLLKDARPPRYLRLSMLKEEKRALGTIMDVTEEVENRQRLEHERDFDLLTNLLNRRAFEGKAAALFANPSALLPVSALVMLDLDNLKTVNDTNGHDNGDLYIHEFAAALDSLRTERCLIGRRSGDEFYMLYYGYGRRPQLMDIIARSWKLLQKRRVVFSDGQTYRMHASGGIAWYPDDAVDFKQLLHYADFAMYRVKNTVKGSLLSFNRDEYGKTGYMVNGIQALNRLLDQTLVRYAYQPIVSAADGSVMGYEMLMRPLVAELPNPEVVLNLAREQGMLNLVESLTWHAALADADRQSSQGALEGDAKLFINTISNQPIPMDDEENLFKRHSELMKRVVMEITENENPNDQQISRKISLIHELGAQIAIDDFGSGYNSDLSLITFKTNYVKLDMSLVRNVHLDKDKQGLITNVIRYAHQRGIKIIAEGVEYTDEVRMLLTLNVDYLQGYYFAKPSFMPGGIQQDMRNKLLMCKTKKKGRG